MNIKATTLVLIAILAIVLAYDDVNTLFQKMTRPQDPNFTGYREDPFGFEADLLLVASASTSAFADGSANHIDGFGIHGVWQSSTSYLDPKKGYSPNNPQHPLWMKAVELRNKEHKEMTLRKNIVNELPEELRDEFLNRWKSINGDDEKFHNHEWSKHGTLIPLSQYQYVVTTCSLRELRRICAANAAQVTKNGKPFTALVKNVHSSYGYVTLLYKVANKYVDCRASGFIRVDYNTQTPPSDIIPKLAFYQDFHD